VQKGNLKKLAFRSRRASKSVFNYKVKQGYHPKSWGYKPSNEVDFKITGAGTTLAGINNSIESLLVKVNFKVIVMMVKEPSLVDKANRSIRLRLTP